VRHLPEGEEGFDVLILADLLFNHSEHGKLVRTVELTLKKTKDAKAYVFFTPYRPWLLEKDLAFFELAREKGFVVEKTFEKVMDKVMFEEDPGVSIPGSWRLAEKLTKGRMNCSDVRYMDMSSVGRLEGGVEQNSRPKYGM
jgi:predicted nicotinamide N-methyase